MENQAAEVIQEVGAALDNWQQQVFALGFWNTLVLAAVVGIVTFIIIRLLGRFFKKKNSGNLKFFYRLIYVIIVLIAVGIVLSTINPLKEFTTTLIAGSGFIAVVIGIAAQSSLGNVFSGISIGAAKPFVIGEVIEIVDQNLMGTVVEIGLRHTVIRDATNKNIVIPNSVIDKEVVRTMGDGDPSICNYLYVGIGYGSDVDMAIKLIKDAALAHKDFFDKRTVAQTEEEKPKDIDVFITEFAASAITLRASVWSKDVATGFAMLSDLRYRILKDFEAKGIEIPYNYQNVIIKEVESEAGMESRTQTEDSFKR